MEPAGFLLGPWAKVAFTTLFYISMQKDKAWVLVVFFHPRLVKYCKEKMTTFFRYLFGWLRSRLQISPPASLEKPGSGGMVRSKFKDNIFHRSFLFQFFLLCLYRVLKYEILHLCWDNIRKSREKSGLFSNELPTWCIFYPDFLKTRKLDPEKILGIHSTVF